MEPEENTQMSFFKEESVKKETKPESKEVDKDLEDISFEAALKELEAILNELQSSDLALDRSMELFRRGTKLVEISRKKLDTAEQEVKEILDNGKIVDYDLADE